MMSGLMILAKFYTRSSTF